MNDAESRHYMNARVKYETADKNPREGPSVHTGAVMVHGGHVVLHGETSETHLPESSVESVEVRVDAEAYSPSDGVTMQPATVHVGRSEVREVDHFEELPHGWRRVAESDGRMMHVTDYPATADVWVEVES